MKQQTLATGNERIRGIPENDAQGGVSLTHGRLGAVRYQKQVPNTAVESDSQQAALVGSSVLRTPAVPHFHVDRPLCGILKDCNVSKTALCLGKLPA